ncbi:hypothetical protein [White spot syndrome virus]|uniref:Wsv161 n=1 Tax=White spot syndrome virus TaxID=342409 RepID=A0A0S2E5Y2_9VIRU|nr:hypothetical protein [White spot syndrome virus]WCQ76723.1 hypothetical protein WSSU-DNA_00133 [White spot syndrome virus]
MPPKHKPNTALKKHIIRNQQRKKEDDAESRFQRNMGQEVSKLDAPTSSKNRQRRKIRTSKILSRSGDCVAGDCSDLENDEGKRDTDQEGGGRGGGNEEEEEGKEEGEGEEQQREEKEEQSEEKEEKDGEEEEEENVEDEHVTPTTSVSKRAKQMKKHIFPPSKKRKRSDTESKALAVPAGKMMTVSRPLRGAITSGSILGVRSENAPQYDYVSYLADEAVVKEKAIQYRIRSLLANLLKANKTKAFPTSSSLLSSEQGKKKFGGKRTNTFVVTNVGAELVKALLANSCWAISHRKDIRSGEIQWQELSSKILKSLNDGNATEINNLMSSIVEDRIQRTVKERVYFEQLATVCNNLFGTRILPNKNFDKNFVSVASDNSNATVRGLSIPRYFRAINNNVWVKMSSTMDLLVGGGMRSKSEHSISMLEKCAAGVLARASARPVEKMIKSAVEETSQAFNLSTGVFVPKQQQQQRQQQQQQFPPFQPPPFPLPPPQAPFQVQQPTYQGYLNPYYQYNQYYNPYAPQQLQQQYPLYFLGNQSQPPPQLQQQQQQQQQPPQPPNNIPPPPTPQQQSPSNIPPPQQQQQQPFPVQLISSPPPPPPIPNTAPSPPISRVRFDSRSTTPQPPPTPVLPKPTPLPPPSTARAEEENATDMSFTDIDSELGSIDFDLPPATPGRNVEEIIKAQRQAVKETGVRGEEEEEEEAFIAPIIRQPRTPGNFRDELLDVNESIYGSDIEPAAAAAAFDWDMGLDDLNGDEPYEFE